MVSVSIVAISFQQLTLWPVESFLLGGQSYMYLQHHYIVQETAMFLYLNNLKQEFTEVQLNTLRNRMMSQFLVWLCNIILNTSNPKLHQHTIRLTHCYVPELSVWNKSIKVLFSRSRMNSHTQQRFLICKFADLLDKVEPCCLPSVSLDPLFPRNDSEMLK